MTNTALDTTALLSIALADGKAYNMGCGLVVVDQLDETQPRRHRHQRVVLTLGALERLTVCGPLSVTLEDGQAEFVGDGLWVVGQVDEAQRGPGRHQRVVLGEADIAALRKLAA